jgi:hypothetical protein
MIFYVALGLWGAVIAYVLVFKQKVAIVAATGMASHAFPMAQTVVASVATAPTIPFTLPTIVHTEMHTEAIEVEETEIHDVIKVLEQHAHTAYALISSDALRFIASQNGTHEEQIATLDHVIALAKARYPKEGDWVVINKERVLAVLS